MNEYIYSFVLFIFYVDALELVKKESDFLSEYGKFRDPVNQILASDNDNPMNSTVYLSVNKYYCMVEEIEDPNILLYGTKSWTFPTQDVNLTLAYPSAQYSESAFSGEDEGYIITGFNVILYIDGMETKGYITRGGVLKDKIVLTFVSRNINTLSYQFWLYGMPKSKSGPGEEWLNPYYLC